MNNLNNEKGITLIELILTISIISIVVFISIPKSSFVLSYKEKKELMEFKKDIVYARNNAICQSCPFRIDMRPKNNYYIIYKLSDRWESVKRKTFKSGLKFELDYLARIEIVFNSTGAPSKGESIYLLNKKGQVIRITITPATGKVNIYY